MSDKPAMTVTVDADTSGFDDAMKAAEENAMDFARTFSQAIQSSIIAGRSFEDTLRAIAMRLAAMALDKAFEPLEAMLGTMLSAAAGNAFSPAMSAGAGHGPPVLAHAYHPTLAALHNPAASANVMPVQASPAVSVVFNVKAQDAAGFRRSEGQLTAMLARAVRRGQRSI